MKYERWFGISQRVRVGLGIAALIAGIWGLVVLVFVIAAGVPVRAFVP